MSINLVCREIEFMGPDFDEAMALRTEILRKPLNMEYKVEDIAQEHNSIHLAGFLDDQIVAYLILKPIDGNIVKMRQVAVSNQFQRQGIGAQLVAFSEKISKSRNFTKIELHARMPAVPFYKALAYDVVGDEFLEVGLAHYKMEKTL